MDANMVQAPVQSSGPTPTATTSDQIPRSSRKRSRSPSSSTMGASPGATHHRRGKSGKHTPKGRNEMGGASKRSNEKHKDFYKRKGPKNDEPKSEADGENPEAKAIYAVEFSKEEIAEEQRRPKRKVAVMVGYCGTGYYGLQIMKDVKTLEGDLFGAFVAAGAISKANADEPKKVQLVRCARTDKGVHAAGNVLSLKLIVEDKDIVQKINSHLPPQIRVWGIEQTINSFNAYQVCDARIYEYLIPTHCFLPPHPNSFLGTKLVELAAEADDTEKYKARQADVETFWTDAEEKYVKPVLAAMDPELREQAVKGVFATVDAVVEPKQEPVDSAANNETARASTEDPTSTIEPSTTNSKPDLTPLELAIRSIKAAHHQAKLAYRIGPERLAKVSSVLDRYVGTHKYHNYTVHKRIDDPSSRRHIKSFVVHGSPFLIGDTEWISLKVHGQSFMMHQIRKMVLMAAMIVRCGTYEARIHDSFATPRLIIPRAPALGLLLERPIFEAYNKYKRHKGQEPRAAIEFDKYQAEIDAFKRESIYERMWKDEGEQQVFANLFGGLDSLRSSQLLWATSLGVDAITQTVGGDINAGGIMEEEEEGDVGAEEG